MLATSTSNGAALLYQPSSMPKSHSVDAISAAALLHNGELQNGGGDFLVTSPDATTPSSSAAQSRRARLARQLKTGRFWLRLLQPWKWRHMSGVAASGNATTAKVRGVKKLSPIKRVTCVRFMRTF